MHASRLAFVVIVAFLSAYGLPGRSTRAETVTYVQQTGNLAATFTDGTAGAFNNGGAEVGMYANGGAKEVASWRDFKTAGDNSGSSRSLQVGDVFTITVSATAASGNMGFSLNDGGTQGFSYDNRVSGSRLYVQAEGTSGSWYVNSATGNSSLDYNVSTTRNDYAFKVYVTSQTTANVLLSVGGTEKRIYNARMNGSAGANIDAFSMWLKDDYNGSSTQNIYWKQATSVENTGIVELGYYLGAAGTFSPGLVTDGLAADSTSTPSANAVFIGGDAGSQVNLTQANTYTGTTTINANASGEAQHADALGSTVLGTSVTSGGVLKLYHASGISFAAEPLTLNGTGVNNADGSLRSVGGDNTWNGAITLGSSSRINADTSGSLTIAGNVSGGSNVLFLGANGADVSISGQLSGIGSTQDSTRTSLYKDGTGTLTLEGSNTYSGDTRITAGTLTVASGGNLGDGSSDVFVSTGATLNINTNTSIASLQETGTENGGVVAIGPGAVLTINGADKGIVYQNSISGVGGLTMAGSGTTTLGLYGTQSYAGTTTVTGGRISTGVSLASASVIVGGGTFETTAANILGESTTVGISSGTYSLGGDDTIGSFSISGGSLTGSGTLTATTYNISGGTVAANLGAGTYNISGTPTITGSTAATGMTVASGSVLDLASSGDFATVISGDGGVSKTGSSTLTLSGNNSYSGSTSINAGTLLFTGTNSGNGTVSVATAAAIGGTGSIAGNLTMAAGSQFSFSQAGGLSVGGTVSFTDPASFGVDDILGLSSTTPDGLYTLFNGTVTTAGLANLGSGNPYDLGNGKSAYFVPGSLKVQVVPEPDSMLAMTAGLAGLAALLRRGSSRR